LLPGAPALAFIRDPDGYSIELIQTSRLTTPAP
jgi:catechol 2,3-dioxygenase-like lactoylglutathione lyase family enzyme